MKQLFTEIEDHIDLYEHGTIDISDDIAFSMRRTVRQVTHYIMSRYLEGGTDNKDPQTGRRRPFRNIVNAIVDLEWRAKNIDRKSIEPHAVDGDYIFSLIVSKELQQWMKDTGIKGFNFGAFIDDYQRKKSEYGHVLLKKTESAGTLKIEVANWENVAVDPRDITNGPKVEKHFLTILDLQAKKDVWDEKYGEELAIDAAIKAAKAGFKSSKGERRIEIWDVEAQFQHCNVDEEDDENEEVGLYNVILAVVGNKKFCVYKTELKESRFKNDARKRIEGRDMGVGVVEECFEPQIWTNEAVIAEKEAMDIAGKVLAKTNKKGLPSVLSLSNGEVIELEADEYFDTIQLGTNAMPKFQAQIDAWFLNLQRDQSAFNGVTGEEPKASTPGISLELQAAQAGSIFNKRRDQDGFFLHEVIVDWVIPFLVKKINKAHKLTAAYSATELKKLDAAIGGMADKEAILSGVGVTPEFQQMVKESLSAQGNERTLFIPKGYITVEKISEKIRFDITDEMSDDQRRLNALAVALQQLPPGDPARVAIIQEMMEISGISPVSFPVEMSGASAPKSAASPTRVEAVLPKGQA